MNTDDFCDNAILRNRSVDIYTDYATKSIYIESLNGVECFALEKNEYIRRKETLCYANQTIIIVMVLYTTKNNMFVFSTFSDQIHLLESSLREDLKLVRSAKNTIVFKRTDSGFAYTYNLRSREISLPHKDTSMHTNTTLKVVHVEHITNDIVYFVRNLHNTCHYADVCITTIADDEYN